MDSTLHNPELAKKPEVKNNIYYYIIPAAVIIIGIIILTSKPSNPPKIEVPNAEGNGKRRKAP